MQRIRDRLEDVPTHVGVDPRPPPTVTHQRRCPHARGGGPVARLSPSCRRRMSPRTWGWTAMAVGRAGVRVDVPTHVGVDRQQGRQGHEKARCPHARGGGPLPCRDGCGWRRMSPRTWGWTTGHQVGRSAVPDVPTHVGVDRLRPRRLRGRRRCPHARGGGPTATCLIVTTLSMSPRTWGWTGGGDGMTRLTPDVPTHVGVDRSCRPSTTAPS